MCAYTDDPTPTSPNLFLPFACIEQSSPGCMFTLMTPPHPHPAQFIPSLGLY